MNNKILLFILILLLTVNASAQTLTEEQFRELTKKLPQEKDQSKKAQLLYQTAKYYLERRDRTKKDIDSAVLLNNQSVKLSRTLGLKNNIVKNMLLDGDIAVEREQYDIAAQLKNKALLYAQHNNLKKEEGDAYQSLATDFADADMPKSAKYYNKALFLYRQTGALYEEAETLSLMASAYQNAGQLELSTKYARQSIQIKKRIKRDDTYKELYYISNNLILLGKYDKALALLLEAEKIAEVKNDSVWIMVTYALIASVYNELKFYEKSVEYNKKAMAIAKQIGDSRSVRIYAVNAAIILYNTGKEAEALANLEEEVHYKPGKECDAFYSGLYLRIYCRLKQYGKAKPYYENLLKCNDEGSVEDLTDKYIVMVNYLIGTGQARKAYTHMKTLDKLVKKRNKIWALSEVEYAYFKVDSATGNYFGAIEHLKKVQSLNDSLLNINSNKLIADLQLKYETEKKDKNIKLLNSQNQLIRIKSEKTQRTKNITFLGIALLLIIVGLLYSRYRIKQKNNRILEENQRELDQKNAFLETLNNDQEKLLKEKEWLIKEVHHRVKNNLQMVTSLLYSQSIYLEDDAAKLAINDSLRRMQAMALIHQKLYQDENTSKIAMPEYINELAGYLNESFDAGSQITFMQDIESINLDVSQAIPLGLIVTESIVNAIKYAFIDERKGIVSISLKHDGDDFLVLKISDDGIGLPTQGDTTKRNSLGLDLMEGLAKQLNGEFTIENNNGVHIKLRFIILQ